MKNVGRLVLVKFLIFLIIKCCVKFLVLIRLDWKYERYDILVLDMDFFMGDNFKCFFKYLRLNWLGVNSFWCYKILKIGFRLLKNVNDVLCILVV